MQVSRFNLSAWALRHRSLVLYLIVLLGVIGSWSYARLGQSEDPPFTFRAMLVRTLWPGASADEVARQIGDRIERKLMETGRYEHIRSYARPGESVVLFVARDNLPSRELPELWYQVRKKVGDIRPLLPAASIGPFFNDEFGDTFGNIYALAGEGFDYAVLRDHAERLEVELQRLPDVAKVELIGLQEEKIWVELSNTRLATLGLSLAAVRAALEAQNAVAPVGFFETPDERVQLRVSGRFDSVEAIADFPLRIGERDFRLADVAEIWRGFADPPAPRMRFMGADVIGLALSMREGGDILRLGRSLDAEIARLSRTLPLGMTLHKVSDQPAAVRASVGEFVQVLAEAVVIVLLVSFFSLGLRTGLVVALSIPLVLAMTFAVMHYFGIGLHKISLGALVLALGLLVDDAIIAVEMMAVKMEQGYDRIRAASFAWSSTAFPMLTGTLITAAGFLPIATAASSTGEYTRSIFQVVTIALLVSWIAAVVFVPYLGDKLLPAPTDGAAAGIAHDPYQSRFYRRFRALVEACMRRRHGVILGTVALFVAALALFRYVPQQFFPDSTRTELLVDLKLSEGASLHATQRQVERLEAHLANMPGVESFVAYVGSGSPRFYLPLDQQLSQASFAQFVLRSADLKAREQVRAQLLTLLAEEFADLRSRVTRLENGPPVGYPVQFRVSGEHIDLVRSFARQVAAIVRTDPHVAQVHLDWEEPSKVVRLELDQARARALGIDSEQLAQFLHTSLLGQRLGIYRENRQRIEILLRGVEDERSQLAQLGSLAVPTAHGHSVPLAQLARLEYGFEEGIIWHRNRQPTVTVRADVLGQALPASVTARILPTLEPIRAQLPPGYRLEIGGTVEDSARGQESVKAGLPLFVAVVFTLLMLQLRSLSRAALVFLTAPLGLIGVTAFLLIFQVPFGFVAMLGSIALSGMIMRNSVILVDQIEQDIAAGHPRWEAVADATVRRFRPIVLTALASVLAMVPLSRSAFFGPMAVAIMGGLIFATILTLLFVPALYAAWFRVREEASAG